MKHIIFCFLLALLMSCNLSAGDRSIGSVEELRQTTGAYDGEIIWLAGYRKEHPGIGGGAFRWDARGTSPDDGGTIIGGRSSGRWDRLEKKLTIEQFGAYPGQGAKASTAAVNAALLSAKGRPVFIPAGRYRYEGGSRTKSIYLVGEKMPVVSADRTRLEGGSILVGSAVFTPGTGRFERFGVDRGAKSFPSSGGDALKISAPGHNAGRGLIVKNVIGLGRSPMDRYHAVLIEGYADVVAIGIRGVHNYYGLAIKARNAKVRGVIAERNGLYGVIIKSDSKKGTTANLEMSKIFVLGHGITRIGLQVESYDSAISDVSVSDLYVRDAMRLVRISGAVAANNISVTDVTGVAIQHPEVMRAGNLRKIHISEVSANSMPVR